MLLLRYLTKISQLASELFESVYENSNKGRASYSNVSPSVLVTSNFDYDLITWHNEQARMETKGFPLKLFDFFYIQSTLSSVVRSDRNSNSIKI